MVTILITGCSPGGIGNALAREFHSRGCHVISTARRDEDLAELRDLGMSAVTLDVTDQKSIDRAAAFVQKVSPKGLDILINNAGAVQVRPLTDTSPSTMRLLLETNIIGAMTMTSTLLPALRRAGGLVLNISSATDRIPMNMTKAALTSYSRTLSVELAPLGVRVMNVVTGYIGSRMCRRTETDDWPADSPFASMEVRAREDSLEASEMPTEEYARRLAAEALRGKGWEVGPWRFGGTKEQVWLGTGLGGAWFVSLLPPALGKVVMYYKFGLSMWP